MRRGGGRPAEGRRAERRRARRSADGEGSRAPATEEVRRLELRARRLLNGPALGAYESVFRGHGVEFAEVRAYQPGDPFQAIDWKVTARMRRPYVKRFVEERELSVLLAVDLSASTRFGTRQRLKRDLAVEVAAVLALAALRSQDRVGLLLFTDRVEHYSPPRRGRNRLLRLLQELVGHRPQGRGTDLPAALDTAARLLVVRSLVFVLSDFPLGDSGPAWARPDLSRVGDGGGSRGQDGHGRREADHGAAALERSLAGLGRRHDVVALEVRDPAEEALPPAGLLEVEDPETGRRGLLDLADPEVRRRLETRAAAEEERRARAFRQARVDRVLLRTDRPYVGPLASFFGARARQRRRW